MTLLNILTAIAACIKSKRDKTNSSASQTNKNNTVKVSFLARDREREFFWFNFSSRSFWHMPGIYMGTVRYRTLTITRQERNFHCISFI